MPSNHRQGRHYGTPPRCWDHTTQPMFSNVFKYYHDYVPNPFHLNYQLWGTKHICPYTKVAAKTEMSINLELLRVFSVVETDEF